MLSVSQCATLWCVQTRLEAEAAGKAGRAEAPIRISPRTGKPVRKYVRRSKVGSGELAPLPFLPDQALVRLRDVMRYTGLKTTSIYAWMKQGRFPRPAAKIGTHYVAWTWLSIRTWLEAQVAP